MNRGFDIDAMSSARWLRLRAFSLFFHVAVYLLSAALVIAQSEAPGSAAEFSRATEFMREGKLDAASSAFAAVVKQNPSFAEAHLNLGLVREEQGKHDDAI